MTYTYQQLGPADVATLRSLLRVFGQAFNDVPTYQNAMRGNRYLMNLLGKRHFIVIVALDGSEVVGGLAAYELEKFEQERREIYIYYLAVAEPHRRRGIATALIRALQRVGRERKAYVTYV
jgi:aminoglycoside 3-N-acetyltransferase I